MRDFKGMKRQRGRNRKPGGANNANNANPNRSWDSQGPENIKVRGNAQTVYERYQQLARDASSSGDRVLAENYQQHAEHYYRVLRALQPQKSFSDIAGTETFIPGNDRPLLSLTGPPSVTLQTTSLPSTATTRRPTLPSSTSSRSSGRASAASPL